MKKVSNKVFFIFAIPAMILSLGIAVGSTVAANFFRDSLDTYIGQGEKIFDGDSVLEANYYNPSFSSDLEGKSNAALAASKVAEELSDEGEVLLKNDGTLPLAEQAKVSPLGYHYDNPTMTGVGSGAATLIQNFVTKPSDSLKRYFDVNKAYEDAILSAKPEYHTKSGTKTADDDDKGTFGGATHNVPEYNPSIYKAEDIGDYKIGLVFIGRQGGEGDDLQMTAYKDNGSTIAAHQLQLMGNEVAMLEFAKEHFSKVIVIVNSPNPLELGQLQDDPKINAILWVGTTGSRGFESMAKILAGKVNPSGHLVDTYARDFTLDPTFPNFGDFHYLNYDAERFVEYEEGIYVGYRYYETRFGKDEAAYAEKVVYPFGYGLHYEDDLVTQNLSSVIYDENDGSITVKGSIHNGSKFDVKETVQLYLDAPYYGGEGESNIEKACKKLLDFEKYEISAGQSKEWTITLNDEDLSSYDYRGFYAGGEGSYVLEQGKYDIHLGDDAHHSFGSLPVQVSKTKVYLDAANKKEGVVYVGKRNSDLAPAINRFDYASDYMDNEGEYGAGNDVKKLTRSDAFEGFVDTPSFLKSASDVVLAQIQSSDQGVDYSALYGNELPTSGANNGLKLSELRGLSYDDPKWDLLLDQLSFDAQGAAEINKLLGNGAFTTNVISAIGKVKTNESDGPQAIGKTGMSDGAGAACAYPAEVVIASTWSKELAKKMGESIGEEALAQNSNGWYAPACNIHRSPFAGRVYEYYSEDPVLSGAMARYVIEGASGKGYTPYLKHFALNEQELGRQSLITWADEQAIREIYLLPFEMAVKQATVTERYYEQNESGLFVEATRQMKGATAMMTSMNRIGGTWTGMSYDLNTNILRKEWGFEGTVITDSITPKNNQLLNAVAAGNDYFLSFMNSKIGDTDSPYARLAIRQAIKNICYAVVNSNVMQGVAPGENFHYAMSPWWWAVIGIDVVFGGAFLALAFFSVRRLIKKRS